MNVLPIALSPKRILLIGAGKAAAQKARAILESDCTLAVIARDLRDPFFQEPFPAPLRLKTFEPEDAHGWEIVINATGDGALSQRLWENRKTFGYWLNCVDQPEYCDFYFTATHRNHDLCVSVSTGGASPRYAQGIRDLVAASLPEQDDAFYRNLRESRKSGKAALASCGKVFLIGCGPGRKEHLTLKALGILPFLEVALIDALVGREIIDLLPQTCRKIDVSKQKGRQQFSQDAINAMMLDYARQGLTVGRLKGGDPFIFGRLFEETSFLLRHGVALEIVNGISSFLAGCLAGGIPPTLRDHSAGVLIVSAHLRETRFNGDWIMLLKDFPYTVIVLMAWSFAGKILETARANGIPMNLPAAFVSNIDRPGQCSVVGTLEQLETMAAQCAKPAILVIGKAVARATELPCNGTRIVLEEGRPLPNAPPETP